MLYNLGFVLLLLFISLQATPLNNKEIFFEYEDFEVINPPKITDYKCSFNSVLHFGYLKNSSNPNVKPEQVNIYYLNKTAEKLRADGYTVVVQDFFDDAISNMTYSKGDFKGRLEYSSYTAIAPVGGDPAEFERSQYMAQLGEKKGDKREFLCDGSLINLEWVLTAAHCFYSPSYELNFVRLGDYDVSIPASPHKEPYGKHIEEYPIGEVAFFPGYNPKYRYHDLALVRLPQKAPRLLTSISPLCLPWDYFGKDFRGEEVVLTGWGATEFGGKKNASLIQVSLKVLDVSVCLKSYSKLPRFSKKHPKGLTDDNIMCVGWEEDGKDACNGDSGAPIVFGNRFREDDDFILAGVVSGGHGCGIKEYPGLYMPIYKFEYLKWIRDVAFKDYE